MNNSLASIFFHRASLFNGREAIQYKEGRSPYKSMSWAELSSLVEDVAFGLAQRGINPGDRAAILSQTSHLWTVCDFATISNGAASVPIYPTSSQSDIEFILTNSEATVVFVQNEQLLRKVVTAREKAQALNTIVLMTSLSKGRSLSDFTAELGLEDGLVIGLSELENCGQKLRKENPGLIKERAEKIDPQSLATIIYTSGTTGTPKGVPLTHNNIISVLEDLKKFIPIDENDVYLSYLPMSHVFERVCGEFYWMQSGGVCAFAEGIETMAKNMAEVQPTMILVVPRVLDKIYAKVRSGIEGASGKARKLIDWAIGIGAQMLEHQSKGTKPRAGLIAKYWLAERLVLKKLRTRIGPKLRLIVSGGAPATGHVIEFFNAIGISTLEGYGLTETAAPACANRLDRVKVGTVGPCLPSVEIVLSEEGEVLLKGPSVFNGYYKADEANREAFVDGWFRTGDIGVIDKDGYLKITDRKKDIIVNSSGKNIAPQKIEAILKTVPFVHQAVVFGDKRKQLVSLIVLDEQAATEHASDKGWNFSSYEDLAKSPELNRFLRKEIDERSRSLADYERVGAFYILPNDLSVEAGELTATLKIKRNVVAKNYEAIINSLYKQEAPAGARSGLVGSRS